MNQTNREPGMGKRRIASAMEGIFNRENLPLLILMLLTAIGITVTSILYGQSAIRVAPLYVSLIIALLQSRVNRYASLLGGFNSLLYAAVYFYYHLYGSAFYAILVSCPIQLITFVRWSKKPWGQTTVFRKFTPLQSICVFGAFGLSTAGLTLILSLTDARYILLDSLTTLLGILISFLTMLAYIEYTPLMLVSCGVSIALYVTMIADTPEQIPYLVFAIYSAICNVKGFVQARRAYAIQQAERKRAKTDAEESEQGEEA